jgi:6,7-dimethyl-8-ribityllumazine synthase
VTEVRTIEPDHSRSSELHIGVVAARWNGSITDRLVEGAVGHLEAQGVGTVTVLRVPGSLELPIGARALARSGCHAVVALGTIVKGDTDHYAIVSQESARGLTLVAHEEGIPVTNGVLAVHDIAHAVERAQPGPSNKGVEAAGAAIETALLLLAAREPMPT